MTLSRPPKSLLAPEQPFRFVLLCLGCAAVGASLGLFAAGIWVGGVVSILLALGLFAALVQPAPRKGNTWSEHSASAAVVWRTRLETGLSTLRARSRLHQIERERGPALLALGWAVREGDRRAAHEASSRLDELDECQRDLEAELNRQVATAHERIRLARLPVQETVMVTPNEPSRPYPPPDEGDPPTPAIFPEPSPPPDEGTPPAPDTGDDD